MAGFADETALGGSQKSTAEVTVLLANSLLEMVVLKPERIAPPPE